MKNDVIYFAENNSTHRGIIIDMLDDITVKICMMPTMTIRFVPMDQIRRTREDCITNYKKEVKEECIPKRCCKSKKKKPIYGKKVTGKVSLF